LFLIPGIVLGLSGLTVGLLLLRGPLWIGQAGFDIHTLLVAGLAVILGEQLAIFAAYTKRLAVMLGLHPKPEPSQRTGGTLSLEHGVVIGMLLAVLGVTLLGWNAWSWQWQGFGPLDPEVTMRRVIPAVVLIALGIQTVFASFFLSFLSLARAQLKPRMTVND
jgi:hypothetical protein